MIKTKLPNGELKLSDEMIFEVINECISEIPGVCSLSNYKLMNISKDQGKQSFFNKRHIKQNQKMSTIQIKWDESKRSYNLNLHIIVYNFANIHTIMGSIYERIMFEMKSKFQIELINVNIYIDDFKEAKY